MVRAMTTVLTPFGTAPRRRLAALAGTVATAGALLLAGASSAQADTTSYTDAAGDVTSFTYVDGSDPVVAEAPTRRRGDVRRVRLAHHESRVVVRYSMRDALSSEYGLFYGIRTPQADYSLVRFRFAEGKSVALTKGSSTKPIRCSGISWDIDHEAATVGMSIPRSCLGSPRWVRVGAGVATFAGDERSYWDDALRTGDNADIRLSSRLYRA